MPDVVNPVEPVNPTESHLLTLNSLAERLKVLVAHGAIEGDKNIRFIHATMNQILKDLEQKRQESEKEVNRLQRLLAIEQAKVRQTATMRTVVFSVINNFALAAESDDDAAMAQRKRDAGEDAELDRFSETDDDEYEYEEVEVEVEEEEEEEPDPPKKKPPRRRKKT